jgi:nicotinamide-nucleotide amidase
MSIQLLHKKLINKKLTISVAESCTGGLLAHNLTKLANSSKYFQMGFTTYSNQSKIKILKVNKNIIKINVSITGIAGPGGSSKNKPVGLVYIGIKNDKNLIVKENRFKSNNRNSIQKLTVREVIKIVLNLI